MKIQVASHLTESETNGPGLRSVLWVQGCPKRCPGCWNPSFLKKDGGQWMEVEEVFLQLTRSPRIEGVTFLGGEPFAQAEALFELALLLKAKNLSLMAYSGSTLPQLKAQGQAQRGLLSQCDLLVDGEFLRDQAGPYLWRGSKNQRIHFLTGRYREWEGRVDEEYRDFELFLEEGRVILTGDPSPEVMEMVKGLKNPNQTDGFHREDAEVAEEHQVLLEALRSKKVVSTPRRQEQQNSIKGH
jgi:anaerobic ribonucleoside-triphosphate reductase activating protein